MDSDTVDPGWDWLEVTRFGFSGEAWGTAQIKLDAVLRRGKRPAKDLQLVVSRGETQASFEPATTSLHRTPGRRRRDRQPLLRWMLTFELPPAIAEDPRAEFALAIGTGQQLELPDPAPVGPPPVIFAQPRRARRGATAVASVTAAVASFSAVPAAAFAKGSDGTPVISTTPTDPTTAVPSTPQSGVPTDPTTTTSTTADPTTTTTVTQTTAAPPPTTTTTTTTTSTSAPAPAPTPPPASTSPAPTGTSSSTTTTTTTSTSVTVTPVSVPATGVGDSATGFSGGSRSGHHHHAKRHHHHAHHAHHVHQHRGVTRSGTTCPAAGLGTATSHDPGQTHSTHCGAGRGRQGTRRHESSQFGGGAGAVVQKHQQAKHATPTPAPLTQLSNSSGNSWQSPIMSDPFNSAQLRHYAALVGGLSQPPKYLVRIYKAAARRYHLPWQVLAAINYVETGYGRDLAVSSAGALGWMQFMPGTWAQYGVSVTPSGKPVAGSPDPWVASDAIFSAAKYLVAAGAHRNLAKAVYAYNHAGWYVQEVLSIAEQITRHGMRAGSKAHRKIAAMTTMARLLNGLPYIWGGGHSNFTMVWPGYDCSGFVSAVLHAGGYLTTPVTTQSLPGQPGIMSGPGRWVTIFDRTYAGIGSDHVIIDIEGQWWESGGSGSGSARVHRMRHVSAAYLQTFNMILHPRGL